MFNYEKIADLIGAEYQLGGRGENNKYDCWGLVREAYYRLHGVILPDVFSVDNPKEQAALISGKSAEEYKQLEKPETGSLLLFTLTPPFATHIGIMIDERSFLHILQARSVCLEKLSGIWKTKLVTAYTYAGKEKTHE